GQGPVPPMERPGGAKVPARGPRRPAGIWPWFPPLFMRSRPRRQTKIPAARNFHAFALRTQRRHLLSLWRVQNPLCNQAISSYFSASPQHRNWDKTCQAGVKKRPSTCQEFTRLLGVLNPLQLLPVLIVGVLVEPAPSIH